MSDQYLLLTQERKWVGKHMFINPVLLSILILIPHLCPSRICSKRKGRRGSWPAALWGHQEIDGGWSTAGEEQSWQGDVLVYF